VGPCPRKGVPNGAILDLPGRVPTRGRAPRAAHRHDDAQVAKDLGISDKTLGNWVRAERAGIARAAEPGALSESEREELRRLRREVHELRTEREILRKAAAYFARETTR